jgi:F0F1-type ATP synthase assembly protein I
MIKTDREQNPTWTRFAGIGIEFAGAVAGFTVIGWFIDRHYNSSPWGVLVGVSLGLGGGMYNLIRESLAASRDAANASHKPQEQDGGKRHET